MTTADVLNAAINQLQTLINSTQNANAALYAQQATLVDQLVAINSQIAQIEGPDIANARRSVSRLQQLVQVQGASL